MHATARNGLRNDGTAFGCRSGEKNSNGASSISSDSRAPVVYKNARILVLIVRPLPVVSNRPFVGGNGYLVFREQVSVSNRKEPVVV
jgi:hypothetical protein